MSLGDTKGGKGGGGGNHNYNNIIRVTIDPDYPGQDEPRREKHT